MKLFKVFIIFIILISLKLSAEIVHYSQLPEELQKTVIPDMEGRVLVSYFDSQLIKNTTLTRELPTVADGWPVSYSGSNCHNGAIYVNMDSDPELEILFGVGTKITALNLDGTTVAGWPVQLSFYIWSSPAAGDIDADGEIEIVCTSRNNTTANSGALYAFELDGTPCTGFPVTQAGGGTNNVCLFDLDSNGDMEILVNVRNHPQGWVYVYDGDGSVYPGFPQELDYIPGAGISAGDITGDGIPEIVALSYNSLHVYDLSGALLDGFPLSNPGYNYSYSQPILCDIDDDGLREIIWGGCSSSAGAVFVVNDDASSVAGWPQTTDQWIFGTVSLGDIDQDGSLDVVVGDQVSSGTPMDYIYAWDAAGNDIAGFPAGPTNAIYAQVGIADLDGDDNVELMIDDNNFGFGYNAYNHDGTHCADWPLDCGTSMYSTTMQMPPVFGDVDNDGDLEIIGAATDIMNWVVECYLWDTDSAWNEDLTYMVIDGVNIQHNGLYDPDESSILYPPRNVQVDEQTCTVSWEIPLPSSNLLTGYNVYLDGVLEAAVGVDVFEYQYTGLIPQTNYIAGVSAIYDEGESVIIEVVFQMGWAPPFQPPTNPDVAVEDYNDVLVTWEPPGGGAVEEIQYHTGYDNNGIGTGAAADFICVARFTGDEISCYYDNWEITRVKILLHSLDFSYVAIQVYEGGSYGDPGTLVYDEEITGSVLIGEFTNHLLSTPVPLVSGNEYWIGYDIQATGDHPAAVDAGPMFPDKGAWMFFSGAWQTLPELGATLDFNWIITGVLSQSDGIASVGGKHSETIGRTHTLRSSSQFEAEVAYDSRREATTPATSNSRSLAGYTVFRDGVEIADIADPAILSWLDESLDAGTYEYTIEAYYIDPPGISEPTDPVNATIILNPPVNLTANLIPPNIILTWDAPNRGIDSYNIYRDDILIEEGITGLMYIDINVPTGIYIYNVTALYEGGYESVFSNDAGWVQGTYPNLIPLVTVLGGNYPNPFNPETTISFSVTQNSDFVTLEIFNIKGQKVKTLVNEILPAGNHSVVWDGTDDHDKKVSSGVYLYKMQAGNYLETKKMILMK
ncbi:MAG: VCBS repeat-containing protein [Candidatus Cloacimonetes bacterium]|nr:VCBS repeat-containing protein [Candidatus Cloacimonadota bacterium]